MKKNKDTLIWLWNLASPLHKKMVLLVSGDVVFAASTVLFVLLCRSIIDQAIAGKIWETIWSAIFLFFIIISQFLFRLILNSVEEYIRSSIGLLMRKEELQELLKKEYTSIKTLHSGEWMNRFFSDVQVVSDGIATILPNLFNMLTRLICAVTVLIFMEPFFALFFLITGIFMSILTAFLRKKMKQLHKDVQEKQGKLQAFLQETIEHFLLIRIFENEESTQRKCEDLQQIHFRAQMKRKEISIAANAGFGLFIQVGYLLTICWGAIGLYYGSMTYGTLTAVLQLVGQIQMPITGLSGILPKYYGMIASAERARELYEFPEESQGEKEKIQSLERIIFDHVGFSYGKTEVLKNVSFQIEAGEIVALTGISGVGKSTIFMLLLGIYSTQNGHIQIVSDGKIFSPGKKTRQIFTYVPQGHGIFSGSILENLRMADKNATEKEMEEALQIACADVFVKRLWNGINTIVGENGAGLSEGQCQRIAIARAVLSKAPVILLDEATSALDMETERKILDNITKLKDRTCLLVTHREAALCICKKQILLKDGNVIERSIETERRSE